MGGSMNLVQNLTKICFVVAVWILILTLIMLKRKKGRPRSLALFTLHREDDRQKQIENYFENVNKFGACTVSLSAAGMVLIITIFSITPFMNDLGGVIPFLFISFGGSFLILGEAFSSVLLKSSNEIGNGQYLEITNEQNVIIRRGKLLSYVALSLIAITWLSMPVIILVITLH